MKKHSFIYNIKLNVFYSIGFFFIVSFVNAQLQNNGPLYVATGTTIFLKTGNFSFGASATTSTFRSNPFGSFAIASGATSSIGTATQFVDGWVSTFPTVTSENEIYFASDGHPGLGGLDVFVSKIEKDGNYKYVVNVGEPINSAQDDFGFLINENSRVGYVTSNREGGIGSDDIYKFKENKKIEYPCEQLLKGVVTEKATGQPLANSKVTFSDANYKMLKEMTTDGEGKFNFGNVVCDSNYYVKADKTDYTTDEKTVSIPNESGETIVTLALEKEVKVVKIGDDLFKAFNIKQIYFDIDKSNIRMDSEIELAKILDVLEQYPTMEIDVRSHTDCRQTAKYNKSLSDRRAKSTKAWLLLKGINKSRITAKGYGESQLVNNCGCEPTNESPCAEAQHQENRRSEFIITKL